MLQFAHIDMNGNEIQNVLAQNLASAPSTNVAAGRFYFNTADHTLYVYNGTSWVDALNQGKIYTFQNGLEELTGNDAGKVQIKLATGDNAGNVVFTANANGLAGTVAAASTSVAGVIEIATDTEVATGTSETLAVNPKQLAGKVDKLQSGPTAGTYTKVTVNAEGQVTAGDTLIASDIPNLASSKINAMTGYTKASTAAAIEATDSLNTAIGKLEKTLDGKIGLGALSIDSGSANYLGYDNTTGKFSAKVDTTVTDNSTNLVTSDAVYEAVKDKIALTNLSVASGSANYLGYNNTTGEFSAKVDTTVTASSTNLVTSGAVESAISTALVGGVIYKGTWDITSATDYSGITLPVKKGYMYLVTGTGPKTIGGIEWNAGDYLMVNEDVAAGGSLTGKVDKIDNTEAADIVRLNATQTLTNKTIDADDNTISDLTTSNLKSGVLQTTVRAVASASDTALASEKAIATAIKDFITASSTNTLTNKTIDGDDNTIQDLQLGVFKSGVVVDSTTGIAAASSASDAKVATEKAIATKLATKVEKFTAQNPALTATSGVCTWTITNSIGSADVQVALYDVTSGAQIGAYVEVGASNIVVKFNSAADIAKDTFKAVVIGL